MAWLRTREPLLWPQISEANPNGPLCFLGRPHQEKAQRRRWPAGPDAAIQPSASRRCPWKASQWWAAGHWDRAAPGSQHRVGPASWVALVRRVAVVMCAVLWRLLDSPAAPLPPAGHDVVDVDRLPAPALLGWGPCGQLGCGLHSSTRWTLGRFLEASNEWPVVPVGAPLP